MTNDEAILMLRRAAEQNHENLSKEGCDPKTIALAMTNTAELVLHELEPALVEAGEA